MTWYCVTAIAEAYKRTIREDEQEIRRTTIDIKMIFVNSKEDTNGYEERKTEKG